MKKKTKNKKSDLFIVNGSYKPLSIDQKISRCLLLDLKDITKGIFYLTFKILSETKLKLVVKKGECSYIYNLETTLEKQSFPLQMGSGKYFFSIMKNTREELYVNVLSFEIDVYLESIFIPYLQSVQNINWLEQYQTIQCAKQLTFNCPCFYDKILKVYSYLLTSLSYDIYKYDTLESTYLPISDRTLASKKGICYDFANLFACMLRSIGIPTKLIMGYTEGIDGYHAWNEAFDGEKWIIIDLTKDISYLKNHCYIEMEKDRVSYHKMKEY